MKKVIVALVSGMFVFTVFSKGPPSLTTEQIKQAIIRESIATYSGNCPCPYNIARNGSSCGRRSAYIRPGGYTPVCYPKDVTVQMVENYRNGHK